MEFLQSRKAIWVFVAIGLIAILTAGISIWYASKYNSDDKDQVKAPEVKKTIVEAEAIPPRFPAGIPLEKDAKIIQNFSITTPGGGFQSSRTFETQRSLDENFALYNQYFNNRNWKIESSSDTAQLKQVTAVKDDLQVQVVLNENTEQNRKTVEITVRDFKNPIAK